MATSALSTWAVSTASLPPSVLHASLRAFYNYIGCAIGGSNHDSVLLAYKSLSAFFGPQTSTILGFQNPSTPTSSSTKADALNTALLNGLSSHIHDYDDTHLETIIHPTGPVASALLAYAESLETKVSGEELLTALAVGIEASCKTGLAVWPSHYDVGWHITASTGSIGAAVAVGKLMHLDAQRMENAISLASAGVNGMRIHFGKHGKALGVGRAAKEGLQAAILAQGGLTGAPAALEGHRGWVGIVCPDAGLGRKRLVEQVDSLGRVWETEKNAFKPFPCGIVVHPIIDACIRVHKDGIDVTQIEKVQLKVHPLVLELTGKKEPKDGLEAKFSVYHWAAVGLVLGKATPAESTDAVVQDETVVGIRRKIEATADNRIGADECEIEIFIAGGGSKKCHVEHAVGSLEVPMTDEMLQEKFLDQVGKVLGGEKASAASDICWKTAELEDAQLLTKLE